jgi:ribosomal protein S27E
LKNRSIDGITVARQLLIFTRFPFQCFYTPPIPNAKLKDFFYKPKIILTFTQKIIMASATCPSCGGKLTITAQNSKMVTCSYCGMISYINAGNLAMIGQKSFLVDYGSILKIGKNGKIKNLDFQVIGRLRIDYEDGFFDEWFLNTPQGTQWLSEDEGKFVFFHECIEINDPRIFDLLTAKVGTSFKYNDLELFITEKSKAKINGGEGELPFQIQPQQKADFVDCLANKKLYSFEFLPNTIELHIGNYLDINDIKVF